MSDPDFDPDDMVPSELVEALGSPLPQQEQQLWASLTPKQRDVALKRVRAINRWHGDRAGWTAPDAAKAAKLSVSRFYRVARDWEDVEQRSLRILGVQASAPRSRRSRYAPMLMDAMEEATRLVADPENERASVTSLATQLHAILRSRFGDVPSVAMLRGVINEARREGTLAHSIGADLGFDLCACSVAAAQHLPHRIFVCIDRGTGYILGTAVGDPAQSLIGHRDAARDALKRIEALEAPIPWADKLLRFQYVIGKDLAESRAWEEQARRNLLGINVNGSNKPRRFGRYLKEHLGVWIGRIRLLPSLTLGGDAAVTSLTRENFTAQEAKIRLDLEVEDHNRTALARMNGPKRQPPKDLMAALKFIASGEDV